MGAGTAVFVCGWGFSPRGVVRSLELVVDGEAQPLMAWECRGGTCFGPCTRQSTRSRPPPWPPIRRPPMTPPSKASEAASGGWHESRNVNTTRTACSCFAAGSKTGRWCRPSSAGSPRPARPPRRSSCLNPCRRTGRSLRSAWRPTSRRSTYYTASSSRSEHRPIAIGSASSRTIARAASASRRSRRPSRAIRASSSHARPAGCTSTATSSARWRLRRPARTTSRCRTRTTSGIRTSSSRS